ncbi:hypothetical protein CWC11_02065 [Pseudoalteromonas sp. S3178]|uniref:hypothetical protein n=1 Tax=Pseudoalteromonas sp. S3178 TaxID=579532 RepID=UPI00110B2ED1|nr:hypothetical protein [Pseudoalteromonas sp. S3178]TMP11032.1 hypothetical protein CWC11_02065 [Pseudoalteromonas sp. S3178]
MSKVWIPVFEHEAVKGQEIMNYRILAVAKKNHFRKFDSKCKIFPFRLLPAGTYRSVLIDTSNPINQRNY